MMKNNKKTILIVFLLLLTIVLAGCGGNDTDAYTKPIEGFSEFWDIFVYPMAGLMWLIGKITGGNYAITIVLATIVVRTVGWPIYGKTNDMQLKMQLAQPELEKMQLKYAGKDDQESKQRMAMETTQLYKKYGIGFGGCLAPLLQMPIFIGFYRTISRMPASILKDGNWIGQVFKNTQIFGVDLLLKQNESFSTVNEVLEIVTSDTWSTQRWGVIILAALVGITQIISIVLSNLRQKQIKEKQVSNIPAYRRPQQSDQQKSTNGVMKFMLYFMAIMMVVFVWGSAAGLGLYWVVGNIYSTFQTWIGHVNSEKRMSKLRLKQEEKNRR